MLDRSHAARQRAAAGERPRQFRTDSEGAHGRNPDSGRGGRSIQPGGRNRAAIQHDAARLRARRTLQHLFGSFENSVKLRIHGNALRLRLNQAEVAQFSKTGWLEEAVEFRARREPGLRTGIVVESRFAARGLSERHAADSSSEPHRERMDYDGARRHLRRTAAERREAALDPDRKRFQVHPQPATLIRKVIRIRRARSLEKWNRAPRAPYAASIRFDPGVVTSWSPSRRGSRSDQADVITKSFRRSTWPAGTAAGNPARRPWSPSPTC